MNFYTIVEEVIEELNQGMKWGDDNTGINDFIFDIEEYKEFQYYGRFFKNFDPIVFISLSYLLCLENLSKRKSKYSIWFLEENNDDQFLIDATKRLHIILNEYISLLYKKNFFCALVLFRTFVELSSYLCLIDFDFYKKFTGEQLESEEKMNELWYKSLKPSKIKSKFKQLKEKYKEYLNSIGVTLFDPRDIPFYLESEFKDDLYKELSKYVHGRFIKNQFTKVSIIGGCTEFLVFTICDLHRLIRPYLVSDSSYEDLRIIITMNLWQKTKSII